jgi:hypothetical protein
MKDLGSAATNVAQIVVSVKNRRDGWCIRRPTAYGAIAQTTIVVIRASADTGGAPAISPSSGRCLHQRRLGIAVRSRWNCSSPHLAGRNRELGIGRLGRLRTWTS